MAVSGGMSGAPVIDEFGQVVGIVTESAQMQSPVATRTIVTGDDAEPAAQTPSIGDPRDPGQPPLAFGSLTPIADLVELFSSKSS